MSGDNNNNSNNTKFETKLLLFKAQNLQGRITLMLKEYNHSKAACKTLEAKIKQSHNYVEDLINGYDANLVYFENKRYYLTFSNYLRLLDSILGFLTEFESKGMFMRFIRRDTYKKSLFLLSQEIEKSLSALKYGLSVRFSSNPDSDRELEQADSEMNKAIQNFDSMKGKVDGASGKRTLLLSEIEEVNQNATNHFEGLELPSRQIKVIPGLSSRQGRNFAVHKRIYKSMEVAEKVYRGSVHDPKILNQIFKQVAILKKLDVCPYILKFYGIHRKTNAFGLISEYAELGNLKEVLTNEGALPFQTLISMTSDLIEGVAFLHNLGILHKNLKTSSVMITSDYKAKLSGFEYSRELEAATAAVVDLGSDRYRWIPPEKIQSYINSTPSGDIYSLGMVLWSLWSALYPYQRFRDRQSIEAYILGGGREDLTLLHPSIAPLVQQCFHEDPQRRPLATQLINDLDQAFPKVFERDGDGDPSPRSSLTNTQTSYLENKPSSRELSNQDELSQQLHGLRLNSNSNNSNAPLRPSVASTNDNTAHLQQRSHSIPPHNPIIQHRNNTLQEPSHSSNIHLNDPNASRISHSHYPFNNSNSTQSSHIHPISIHNSNITSQATTNQLETSQFGEDKLNDVDILEGECVESLIQDPLHMMEEAVVDHNEQRYQQAFDKFHHLQKYGYTRANYFLGYYYFWGQEGVVEKNLAESIRHLEIAAQANDSDALDLLGLAYRDKDNPMMDLVKAFNYFKLSAQLGNRKGYYHLFAAYAAGKGTPRNPSLAKEMLINAAVLGYPAAIQQAKRLGIEF